MTDINNQTPWPLELYKYSFKKKDKINQILAELPFSGQEKALDIGCANGVWSYLLQSRVGALYGVEPNPLYLAEAQKIVTKGELVLGQAEALSFTDNFFDQVFLLDVLYYTDEAKTISEMGRVLVPSGLAVVTVPYLHPTWLLDRLKTWLGQDFFHEGGKRRGYDMQDIEKLFTGWRIEKVRYHSIFFVELIETLLNGVRRKKKISNQTSVAEKNISDSSLFFFFRLVYPLLIPAFWLDNLLRLVGFKGHGMVLFLRKNAK